MEHIATDSRTTPSDGVQWTLPDRPDIYIGLRDRYRELAEEYLHLQREHNDLRAHMAVVAGFLAYMARRLQRPADELEGAAEHAADARLRHLLEGNATRLRQIISELAKVAEQTRQERTGRTLEVTYEPSKAEDVGIAFAAQRA